MRRGVRWKRFWKTWPSTTPRSRAASIIASASASDCAMGFSMSTCFPAAIACRAISSWNRTGAQTSTTCTSSLSSASARFPYQVPGPSSPHSRARCWARSGTGSQKARISTPGILPASRTRIPDARPHPTTSTPSRSVAGDRTLRSSTVREEHLAGVPGHERPVGDVGLFERVAVGRERFRAVALTVQRDDLLEVGQGEVDRADQRELLVDDLAARVDRELRVLADEADLALGPRDVEREGLGLGSTDAVEHDGRAEPGGQLVRGRDQVGRRRVEDDRAGLRAEVAPVGRGLGDDHTEAEMPQDAQHAEPDRAGADDQNRIERGHAGALDRPVARPDEVAAQEHARLERYVVRQDEARAARRGEVVAVAAPEGLEVEAVLRLAAQAPVAVAAAVRHDADRDAVAGAKRVDRVGLDDLADELVPGVRRRATPIAVELASADRAVSDPDQHVPRTGDGSRHLADLDPAVADKHECAHLGHSRRAVASAAARSGRSPPSGGRRSARPRPSYGTARPS